ncbi:MAG TPA: serine/threonine-protein kinase [Ktedonobacterales bacterium]
MAEQGPLTGQRLGDKFLLGELLGQGGFGAVYKAQHLLLNRPQAIKVLREEYFSDPKFRERFIREAQTLAALDHANILPVHDFGVEGSRAYLVMPFISGGTLQGVLKARPGPLSLEDTARYLEQICAALDYAHKRKKPVVHLDLKPLNLLVHEDGHLLLSDFGLAHLMEQGALEGGTSLQFGSPLYMAPEHFDGKPEQRSDLYALGIILYQLLAGRVPFTGTSAMALMLQHMKEVPPSLHAARPDLPPPLDGVLSKALAKQPAQRYQSAGELLYEFQAAAGRLSQPSGGASSLLNAQTRVSQPQLPETVRAVNPPMAPLDSTKSPPLSSPLSALEPAPQASFPISRLLLGIGLLLVLGFATQFVLTFLFEFIPGKGQEVLFTSPLLGPVTEYLLAWIVVLIGIAYGLYRFLFKRSSRTKKSQSL